ncbi:ABC transporter permease subunit [Metamycoplasma hyosynoviae]|uniref:ABC transporter permease subunit n=1 Tax=Metamycoplasma hyosynoviae TaxID=29559 RepID=UPI0023609634|nr:ABC transporter permease subunit [Metamycoplasma hyosynoviae]MDD1359242.1 ABC transporter permease subunit [Metamycoplasma hyosynoviae]MDD1359934.1 ABC transporter permease subunit [Metamycoplasma hyosynoviae]MDD1377988.1 ABC transporter permease subunit [Metamycoplasma hyosynoviae]MDD1378844.1 ABC transporter permease subunit [Metamycoplasma hyosynoviae]MDD7893279.1 ABC transporter permease subunit [Metamycoplasma hyosynoviae]
MKDYLNSDRIQLKNYLFFEKINSKNITIKNQKTPFKKLFFWFFIFLIFVISFVVVRWTPAKYGFNLFFENIKNFFNPIVKSEYIKDSNLFTISFYLLFQTINYSLLGLLIGGSLAFLTSYLFALKFKNKWIYSISKIFFTILRILPEIIFIYYFSNSFSKKMSVVIIFALFNWIWLHEYFTQMFENVNYTFYFHLLKNSYSKFKAFQIEVFPQIKIKILNLFLYTFESNIRWSVIISKLGFLGIGTLLTSPIINISYFRELLIPLFVLVFFLVTVEFSFNLIKKYIYETKTAINENKYFKHKIYKKLFNWLIFIFLASFIIFNIIYLKDTKFYTSNSTEYFKDFFNPSFKEINNNLGKNTFYIVELLLLIFTCNFLVFIFTYISLFLLNKKMNNKYYSAFIRITNVIFRNVPIIILFLFTSPIFKNPQVAFIIGFAIHSTFVINKNMDEYINYDGYEKNIELLHSYGMSKWKIYRTYLRPKIASNFITFFTFEIEKNTRNFINYGIFASSTIGLKTTITNGREYIDIVPYLWISIAIIFVVYISGYFIRKKINKN